MTLRVGDSVIVHGEHLVIKELFRATGVKWVRYDLARNEPTKGRNTEYMPSRYVTEVEWRNWTRGNTQ